jgi:hypothetical protein
MAANTRIASIMAKPVPMQFLQVCRGENPTTGWVEILCGCTLLPLQELFQISG